VKILVVGASGLFGSAVADALSGRHEVLAASRRGPHRVDLRDPASIGALYASIGPVDAVACVAGAVPFERVGELTLDDFREGVADKLLGQVELVRQGIPHVRDGGSFTLVSGVLSEEPILTGAVAALVNGGVDAFVRATAIDLPRGLRINAVSATVFEEAWGAYGPFFPGFRPVPVAEGARAFVRSIEGADTGRIYRIGY
jgi:NAD(P)-dependent dehydrogenase (short-subunit alcohol dehydrogenase family)